MALFVGGIFAVVYFGAPGGRKMLDNEFGDQHLKTSVALIELHKVRYGRYPDSLSDLKFTGQVGPDRFAEGSLLRKRRSDGVLHRSRNRLDG